MSSMRADSRPPAGATPSGSHSSRSISWAVSDRASRPRALASRLAGSIVTTTALRPWRAPARARTAAVVVFPTPPLPQHTMIGCSAASRASGPSATPVASITPPTGRASTPAVRASARTSSSPGPMSAENRNGRTTRGRSSRSARRASCSSCSRRRRVRKRAARARCSTSPSGTVTPAARRRRPDLLGRGHPVERPVGVDAVDHQRPERQADPFGERLGRLHRLVDRRLLRAG